MATRIASLLRSKPQFLTGIVDNQSPALGEVTAFNLALLMGSLYSAETTALSDSISGLSHIFLHGLPLISRNALPLSSSILLVRVGALLLLAYPRDQCLGLCSTFYLLLILVLYLHPALWRVIPMPMTSKPTSTAWHHKLILQFESFCMPRTPLMHGCRLIACF